MRQKRVVITGLGVIASNGIGRKAFSQAIFSGIAGIKPISLFDTSAFKAKLAGEIADFKAEEFLGAKGLRNLDRSTKLAASASKLALDDAQLEINAENTHDIGVAVGDTFGSLASVSDFDKEALIEGPRYVNPALFPNTVINSPASEVSIKFGIKGFNTTISTGFCAGLDAVNYAVDFLKFGRAKIVLAGAVEELCVQTFLGFYKGGLLAGLTGGEEISCPFDKRRNGVILGEGAAILILEDLASALSRKARIYAEVLGFGTGFDAYRINKYCPRGGGLKKAMTLAMEEARLSAGDIDFICAGANSHPQGDLLEAGAIKDVFGDAAKNIPVSSVKSMTGECFSASGSLQAVAAAESIQRQMIPPTINHADKDPACDLNIVNKACGAKIENILINNFGPNGANSSLVISKFSRF